MNLAPFHWFQTLSICDAKFGTGRVNLPRNLVQTIGSYYAPRRRVAVIGYTEHDKGVICVYTPWIDTWVSLYHSKFDPQYHCLATQLTTNKVLVVVGERPSVRRSYLISPDWLKTDVDIDDATDDNVRQVRMPPSDSSVGDILYTHGGKTVYHDWMRTTHQYHPSTDTWTELFRNADIERLRSDVVIVAPDGKIVSIASNMPRCCSDKYDPATNEITPFPSLLSFRTEHAAVAFPNGDILVSGGRVWNQRELLATCEMYEASSGQWREAPSMNIPRYHHKMVLIDAHTVIVIGGGNEAGVWTDLCEIFDTITGGWRMVQRTPVCRWWTGSCSFE